MTTGVGEVVCVCVCDKDGMSDGEVGVCDFNRAKCEMTTVCDTVMRSPHAAN